MRGCTRSTALLFALLLSGCGGDEPVPEGSAVALIGDEYSERRYSPLRSFGRTVTIDFTDPAGAREIRIIAADAEQQAEGLLLRPSSNDPILGLLDPVFGFNQVMVEMRSGRAGTIEVFWAGDDEEFSAERSRRLEVERSAGFEEYVFDLAAELVAYESPYRLRIDPLDQEAPFVLRKIELAQTRFRAQDDAGDAPLARKVRLGNETRVALVVPAGQTVSKPVELPPEPILSFAVGKAPRNSTDVRFRLAFRDQEGGGTVLLDELLEVGDPALWREHSLSLSQLGGRSGHLEASLQSGDREEAEEGVAFWATPLLSGGPAGESARRPNVLLLSIDTLGASHLSAYGARDATDGFLARLAERGAVFENSFAASAVTHVSHGSLLTGRAPLEGNLFWLGGNRITDRTLAGSLRESGYRTAAFTGGILVTESLGFDRGFEEFYQHDTLREEPLDRSDVEVLLEKAEDWVTRQSAPWFLFLHSYEVHSPYYLREPGSGRRPTRSDYFNVEHMKGLNPVPAAEAGRYMYRLDEHGQAVTRIGEKIDATDFEEIEGAYESEIAFLDRAIDRFFTSLESRGQLENTVVVVTSDHGEAFFEHNLLEHGLLYDENLRVPLVVVAPGRVPAGVRVAEPVTAIDVVPTVLDLVGIRSDPGLAGRSLVEAMRGGRLAPEPSYAFVPGNGLAIDDGAGRKLIRRLGLLNENFSRDELFDRRNDPEERNDLLPSGGNRTERLQTAVARLVEGFPGIHLVLSDFAGETCALTLDGDHINREQVYAVEMVAQEPMRKVTDGPWTGVMRLQQHPRVVLMGIPSAGELDLELRCGGAETSRFEIDYSAFGARAVRLEAATGTGSVSGWRIAREGAADTESGGFTAEEEETLRSLGYIQ